MEFKKIIIAYKWGLERVAGELVHLIRSINGSHIEAMHHRSLKKSIIKGADLIITLGGDGTFIEAANFVEDSFIIGINSNPKKSEGALTSLTIEEADSLKEILQGKYLIEEWQRAKIILNGKQLKEYATNEVYIGARSQFHSSRYIINYKEKSEEQRSSGIIISTGTGSPAWFKSAGGYEFEKDEKKLAFVIREPYPGKRVYVPTIFGGEISEGEKLIVESTRDFGGVIAIGFKSHKFNMGDKVEISLADKPLKVLKI